ncbi:hypothetical protein HMPREF0372_02569 [Flavonifractor plautii ATCC 29863]|uniref:Uncharacterized protein n=1 Tax=Flavonifractor plautii ATCC 29863 TaxID=411475 RepID=G9YSR0_FLAPL|nr:hypothetical protein HMPREF0372_02569 [Flavonifractor plautii ATCC 29863]
MFFKFYNRRPVFNMKFRRIIHPGERCLHATPISIRKVGQEPVTQLGQFLDEASQYSGDQTEPAPFSNRGQALYIEGPGTIKF